MEHLPAHAHHARVTAYSTVQQQSLDSLESPVTGKYPLLAETCQRLLHKPDSTHPCHACWLCVLMYNLTTQSQSVSARREHGNQLAQLLQNRSTDAALDMLSAEPSLAWAQDDDSGGYPLHIAVWHVRNFQSAFMVLCR